MGTSQDIIPFFSKLWSFAIFLKLSSKYCLDILLVCREDEASTSSDCLDGIWVFGISNGSEDLVPTTISLVLQAR